VAHGTTAIGIVNQSSSPLASTLGMRLSVFHRTTFNYGSPATNSINTLHLEPRTFPYQKTLSALIRVMPATRVRRFTDLFQNITHHFELTRPHGRLEIESRIRVHNLPLDISDESKSATVVKFDDTSIRELIWPYLQDSRWVSRHPEVWREALDITRGIPAVFDQATALMQWIYREFRYEPGATNVNTHLEEAFRMRHGVCQDFTHVMLGLCRSVGIPARYASGYLYNGPRDSLVGAQASHAWSEVYLPGAGWIGFDPTNNTLADERYVKVSIGRDYEDVAPVRGNYQGTGHCRMEVEVEVEKI
jgi:transglutaminase-like putative cysteine protease